MKPLESGMNSSEPFNNRTGYKDDYIRHALPERFKKEQAHYVPNKAPLDDLSNYRKDYVLKDASKMPSCKPDASAFRSDAPLEDATTNKTDYIKWPSERPHHHEPDTYRKPDGDFDFNTTHKYDYTKKAIERPIMYRPASRKRIPGKFDDSTNYNTDYRKWDGVHPPAQKKPLGYVAPGDPFVGSSNYTDSFIPYNMAPPRSMRPTDGGFQSNAPFDGHTEYKQEYIRKNIAPCPGGVILSGGTAGFKYMDQDEQGHKWYQPGVTTSYVDLKAGGSGINEANVSQQLTALPVA
jgi:hypothetical protein